MAVDLIVIERKPKEQRAAELIQRFHYAERWRRQYDQRAVEAYKLYVGYREPIDDPELKGRSNLHIPKTYEHVDTIRARLVKTFFSVRPYIDFVPVPTGTTLVSEENDRKARVAAALVDLQLERNNILRVWYDFITSLLVFPAGILAVGWRYETKQVRRRVTQPLVNETGQIVGFTVVEVEQPVVAWDDNEIVNVDFFDFWPDPRGRDIDSCRFVFHREWATRKEVEEKLALLADAGAGEVFDLDLDALASASSAIEEGRTQRLTAVGLAAETEDGFYEGEEGASRNQLYELLHYWEDERHAILINRVALAYDGPNPYWRHSKKPFVVASYEPLPNEFYGLSAVQIIQHLQEELNTHRNQRIDNVSFVLNRMWRVDPDADIDESELVSRPHGIVHARQGEIEALNVPEVTGSAFNEEAVIKMDMEHALGTPAIVRGVDPTRAETATEIVTKANNASLRFDIKIGLMEAAIKRLAYLMDCNNQQFVDAPRLVKLFGPDDAILWASVQPADLIGEFDYRPASQLVDPAVNRELLRQRLTEVLVQAYSLNNPWLDKYELTRAWADALDLPKRYRIVRPKEEVIQQYLRLQQGPQAYMQPQRPVLFGPNGQPLAQGAAT